MIPPEQIFVVGSGRSGTTIVLEAVATLPDVTPIPRLAGRLPALTTISAFAMKRGWGPKSWIRPSSEATGIFAKAGLTQQFQSSLGGRSIGLLDTPRLRMDRLESKIRTISNVTGAKTVVIKNTASCGRVPILAATFPGAHFIHVVRDPHAVVQSLLNVDFWPTMTLWWDGRTTQEYGRAEGIGQAQVASRHWARQVATVLADLEHDVPADRRLTMSYRDFTNNPIKELSRLAAWGLDLGTPLSLAHRVTSLSIRPDHARSLDYRDDIASAVVAECGDLTPSLASLW